MRRTTGSRTVTTGAFSTARGRRGTSPIRWRASAESVRFAVKFGSWGFTSEDVTNLFEPRYLGIDLLQYFWNRHDYLV